MSGEKPLNAAAAVRMAAHSTSDFPLILENALGKSIARRVGLRMPDIVRAASKKTNTDYRPSKSLTLSTLKAVREIGEGGEINHSTMDEKGESNPALRDFGGAFTVTNKVIVNDDLGFLDQAAQRMTEACIQVQRSVLLEPIEANSGAGQTMADGKAMFHADHGNLAAAGDLLMSAHRRIAELLRSMPVRPALQASGGLLQSLRRKGQIGSCRDAGRTASCRRRRRKRGHSWWISFLVRGSIAPELRGAFFGEGAQAFLQVP